MAHALLHLGGNQLALAALRLAREAGLEIVVADPDPRAPGRRYADRFECLAPGDQEHVAELARSLGRRLVAVCPASDAWLASAALAQEIAGLPGVDRAARETLADPAATHRALEEQGLLCATADASARTLHVEGFFRDDVYVPAGIGERFLVGAAHPSGDRGSIQAVLEPAAAAAIHELVERGARALGLEHGPLCARVQHGAAGPALATLVPRFECGPFTAHATALAYGKSPLSAWFAALAGAGGPFDGMPGAPERCAGWLALRVMREGVFQGVAGAEAARALPGCERILVLVPPGTNVHRAADERGWVGLVFASGRDAAEVEERLGRIRSRLAVEVTCRSVA